MSFLPEHDIVAHNIYTGHNILFLSESSKEGFHTQMINALCSSLMLYYKDQFSIDSAICMNFSDFCDGSIEESTKDVLDKFSLIFFVLPEWNGSFPYSAKQMIDNSGWPSAFKGKNVVLIGSGERFGNVNGISHMRDILSYVDAVVDSKAFYLSGSKERVVSDIFDQECDSPVLNFCAKMCKKYISVPRMKLIEYICNTRKSDTNMHKQQIFQPYEDIEAVGCLHDQMNCCENGINKIHGGMCIHLLSCPCPKCTPRY